MDNRTHRSKELNIANHRKTDSEIPTPCELQSGFGAISRFSTLFPNQCLVRPSFLVLLLLSTASVCQAQHESKRLPYITTWVANSFPGGEKWVQNSMITAAVDPGGTITTWSLWDEDGRARGIYKGVQNPDGTWKGDVIGNRRGRAQASDVTNWEVEIAGAKWVIDGYKNMARSDKARIQRSGKTVNKAGTDIGIKDIIKATALGVDRINHLLMVCGEGGYRHAIRYYEQDGKLVKEFGKTGGYWPGNTWLGRATRCRIMIPRPGAATPAGRYGTATAARS